MATTARAPWPEPAEVARDQRFTREHPCPICGGSSHDPRGHGVRCYGFGSEDGQWAHCTREEHAGSLEQNEASHTFAHRLAGQCGCGSAHATFDAMADVPAIQLKDPATFLRDLLGRGVDARMIPTHVVMQDDPMGEKFTTVHRHPTLQDCRDHLAGKKTIGGYLKHGEGTRAICFDVDGPKKGQPLSMLEEAAGELYREGARPLLETSPLPDDHDHAGGGKLWLVFDRLVDASAAFAKAEEICPQLRLIGERFPGSGRVRVPGGLYRQGINKPCELQAFGAEDDSWYTCEMAIKVIMDNQTPADWVASRSSLPKSAVPERGPQWPTLDHAALYGLAGDIVRAIEPHTEADLAALLANTLVSFGNAAGNSPHAIADGSRHPGNLFVVTVARTGKGRKGTAWARVKGLFRRVDERWVDNCLSGGLSSGEGLISAVRDPSEKVDGEGNPVDPGASDKRLLVVEEEFAGVLKIATRDGNILSTTLRQGWDSGVLRVMTRNNPLRATGAHISIVGHITREELLKYLTETEYGSGFANRFLWICAKRSKLLPDGGGEPDFRQIVPRLQEALAFARTCTATIQRDSEARDLWRAHYGTVSAEREGLFGAITGRAEAQVLRLSMLYALMDCSPGVRVEHLHAALALWRYAEDSVAHIFGDIAGNATADRILDALRRVGSGGMSRTQISNLFGRNLQASRIEAALRSLELAGKVQRFTERRAGTTDGRPAEVYIAV